MNFRTSCLVPAALSLFLGAGVWYMASGAPATAPVTAPAPETGYGILSVDAGYGDRMVGELLAQGGLDSWLSESTQWVFLDDFGELLRIPLDTYEERVAPFDPRNDGYPGRLRSFFVHGGRRLFFIPLSRVPKGANLEEELGRWLGDIPFRLDLPLSPQPRVLYRSLARSLLFAAAALVLALLSRLSLGGICLLPLLGALCLGGGGGFALAAVLSALFALLRDPLGEFFVSRRYGFREGPLRVLFRGGRGALIPLVTALYGGICALSGFPPGAGSAAILSFFLILPLALRAESNRGAGLGHIRFVPVPISGRGARRGRAARLPLPFAAASLAVLALPPLPGFLPRADSGAAWAGLEDHAVDSAAYYAHAAFQQSFSRQPLRYGEGAAEDGEYLRYRLGADGLIGEALPGSPGGGEIPPFPLEDLTAFLARPRPAPAAPAAPGPEEAVSTLAILVLCVPALFPAREGRRNKKKYLIYHDKRIAA